MKTLVIIMSILAFTVTAHGYDPKRSLNFYNIARECYEDYKDKSEPYATVFFCVLAREKRAINKFGVFDYEESIKLIEDLIWNEELMKRGKELFQDCYMSALASDRQPYQSHTWPIVRCAMILMPLFDISEKNEFRFFPYET